MAFFSLGVVGVMCSVAGQCDGVVWIFSTSGFHRFFATKHPNPTPKGAPFYIASRNRKLTHHPNPTRLRRRLRKS